MLTLGQQKFGWSYLLRNAIRNRCGLFRPPPKLWTVHTRCKVYFQASYNSEFFLLVCSSSHSADLKWEPCMPSVYLCSCKSSRYMWLVSINFEFQLSTVKCSSPSSPGLFTVSHTHGNVSNNAQTVERDPSYTELSYENSLEIGILKSSLKVSPQNPHP